MTDRAGAIERLIGRTSEGKDFDFKESMRWDKSNPDCIGIIKDIIAMANSGGGQIVIGVRETPHGWERDGVAEDHLESWDPSKLGEVLREYADPPVQFDLQRVTHDDQHFVVLTVRPFSKLPHVCKKTYQKPGVRGEDAYVLRTFSLYIRTEAAQSMSIQSADQMDDLIERAVRNQQDRMLAAMRAILTGVPESAVQESHGRFEEQAADTLGEATDPFSDKGYTGYYTHVMLPASFDLARFSISELLNASRKGRTNFPTTMPFLFQPGWADDPVVTNDGIRQELSGKSSGCADFYVFWALRRSGLVVQRNLMWEATEFAGENVIDPVNIVRQIADALYAMVQVYDSLELLDEAVTWKFRIDGTQDRKLVSLNPNRYLRQGRQARIPFISYERTLPIAEWRAGLVDLTTEATIDVLQRFGWEHSGGPFKEWVEKFYAKADW